MFIFPLHSSIFLLILSPHLRKLRLFFTLGRNRHSVFVCRHLVHTRGNVNLLIFVKNKQYPPLKLKRRSLVVSEHWLNLWYHISNQIWHVTVTGMHIGIQIIKLNPSNSKSRDTNHSNGMSRDKNCLFFMCFSTKYHIFLLLHNRDRHTTMPLCWFSHMKQAHLIRKLLNLFLCVFE